MRPRLAMFGLVAVLVAGTWRSDQPLVPQEAGELDGAWEIASVHRDGAADELLIGAFLAVGGNRVTYRPKPLPSVQSFVNSTVLPAEKEPKNLEPLVVF
jgi:hypothetical protein